MLPSGITLLGVENWVTKLTELGASYPEFRAPRTSMPGSKDSKRFAMTTAKPWKPRQSGNPSGSPKGTCDLSGFVVETTDDGKELIDALVFIAMTPRIQ